MERNGQFKTVLRPDLYLQFLTVWFSYTTQVLRESAKTPTTWECGIPQNRTIQVTFWNMTLAFSYVNEIKGSLKNASHYVTLGFMREGRNLYNKPFK